MSECSAIPAERVKAGNFPEGKRLLSVTAGALTGDGITYALTDNVGNYDLIFISICSPSTGNYGINLSMYFGNSTNDICGSQIGTNVRYVMYIFQKNQSYYTKQNFRNDSADNFPLSAISGTTLKVKTSSSNVTFPAGLEISVFGLKF